MTRNMHVNMLVDVCRLTAEQCALVNILAVNICNFVP